MELKLKNADKQKSPSPTVGDTKSTTTSIPTKTDK